VKHLFVSGHIAVIEAGKSGGKSRDIGISRRFSLKLQLILHMKEDAMTDAVGIEAVIELLKKRICDVGMESRKGPIHPKGPHML